MDSTESAMCTICGWASEITTDFENREGDAIASALKFAAHFAVEHPGLDRGVLEHVVMVEVARKP